jgi:transcriptional regulator with XRE-family HTH domain
MSQSLKALRESAGLTQLQVAKLVGISPAKLSLAENHIGSLTRQEDESIREAIAQSTKERAIAVLLEADPRLGIALKEIQGSVTKTRLFERFRKSGLSIHESALATLGRAYTK